MTEMHLSLIFQKTQVTFPLLVLTRTNFQKTLLSTVRTLSTAGKKINKQRNVKLWVDVITCTSMIWIFRMTQVNTYSDVGYTYSFRGDTMPYMADYFSCVFVFIPHILSLNDLIQSLTALSKPAQSWNINKAFNCNASKQLNYSHNQSKCNNYIIVRLQPGFFCREREPHRTKRGIAQCVSLGPDWL